MTAGPSSAVSLEPLANCQNVASLIFSYRYFFGKLAQLVTLPHS